MTGRLRAGKMSTFIRLKASTPAKAVPAIRTITVIGRRRAAEMGFMGATRVIREAASGPYLLAGRQTGSGGGGATDGTSAGGASGAGLGGAGGIGGIDGGSLGMVCVGAGCG